MQKLPPFYLRSIKPAALSLSQSESSIGLNNSHPRFPAAWAHCNKFSNSQLVNQIEKLKRADLNWKRKNLKPLKL